MAINAEMTKNVSEDALFTTDDDIATQRIDFSHPHNFVTITSLDDTGNAVIPSGGMYEIFVKKTKTSGFAAIGDNGTVDATKTGGNLMPPGDQVESSFAGNAMEILVRPNGVVGAVNYSVTVTQNLT